MRTRPPPPLLAVLLFGSVCLASAVSDFDIPSGSNGLEVDLSGRNLSQSVRLAVVMTTPKPLPGELTGTIALRLLNVSGNPQLRNIVVDGSLQVMQIDTLDISGTSVTPTKELIEFNSPQDVLLTIRQVFINCTAQPETLFDLQSFAELLYRLRSQTFVLDGWPVTNFSANFSQADNFCQSKNFESISVRRARIHRLTDAVVSATQSIDFSFNDISEALGVSFSSASVDLRGNRLSRLASVSFKPGASCRTEVTGPPEVRLDDNALTVATLVEAIESSASQPIVLRGLDLSHNPLVASMPTTGKPEKRIQVTEWLRLRAVVGSKAGDDSNRNLTARRLGSLLSRLFEPPKVGGPASLDLSSNQLDSLAAASHVLLAWTGGGPSAAGGPLQLAELRLAGWNAHTDHLNLSELDPAVRPTQWLDLGDLGNGVRSLSVVANQSVNDSFNGMKAAWNGEVRLQPLPGACCRAQGSNDRLLFCFIRPETHAGYRRLICGGQERPPTAPPTPPLPPAPALVLALAAVAACLAILLVAVAVVGCVRRRRKHQSTRLRSEPQKSPRQDVGVEATALRPYGIL
uniref:LRRCT domain-containing protein n=1 Tax=Macrostomum lignano TaxID=282301 RepID=A0A1I8JCS0_9PLAT